MTGSSGKSRQPSGDVFSTSSSQEEEEEEKEEEQLQKEEDLDEKDKQEVKNCSDPVLARYYLYDID